MQFMVRIMHSCGLAATTAVSFIIQFIMMHGQYTIKGGSQVTPSNR
jgi:hypothetical protein